MEHKRNPHGKRTMMVSKRFDRKKRLVQMMGVKLSAKRRRIRRPVLVSVKALLFWMRVKLRTERKKASRKRKMLRMRIEAL